MLTSLAYVLLLGMALGALARRLRLPSLVGMLLAGILLGPCVLNLLSPSLLGISADLRQLALVIILTRAGLSLELEDLRRGWTCWTPPLWAQWWGRCPPRSSFPGCSG